MSDIYCYHRREQMFVSPFIHSKQYLLNASWVPATVLGRKIQAIQDHINYVHLSEEKWNDEGDIFELHLAEAEMRRDYCTLFIYLVWGQGWCVPGFAMPLTSYFFVFIWAPLLAKILGPVPNLWENDYKLYTWGSRECVLTHLFSGDKMLFAQQVRAQRPLG